MLGKFGSSMTGVGNPAPVVCSASTDTTTAAATAVRGADEIRSLRAIAFHSAASYPKSQWAQGLGASVASIASVASFASLASIASIALRVCRVQLLLRKRRYGLTPPCALGVDPQPLLGATELAGVRRHARSAQVTLWTR